MIAYQENQRAAMSSLNQSKTLIDWLCFNCKQSAHYNIGFFGEKVAQALFEDAGYKAYKPETYHGVDLHVIDKSTGELHTVEVKTARLSEGRKTWQFCLNKAKNCSLCNAAYILLILIAEKGIFTYLIPSQFFGKVKSFAITSHPNQYRGMVASFRNRGALSFAFADDIYSLARLQ